MARYDLVVGESKVVDEKCADDDDGRRKNDTRHNTPADNRLVLLPWRLTHHVVVNGVNAKRLARRA
jgi:hypothetical protein